MATPTFGDVWRRVRLYVSSAPVFLIRAWVQDSYRELCDRRGWTWLIMEGQIVWGNSRTFDVTTALGSATVTSAALFLTTDAGRQFRVGTFPTYTILAVVDPSTITLDRVFELPSGGGVAQGTVLDQYTTLPANFSRFTVVVDPVNQRLIPFWGTQEELDLIDPMRTSGGAPRLLIPRRLSTYPPTRGQMQYEFWPVPSVAGAFQYYAVKAPEALADNDPLPGLLANRVDILETGALARAAKYPGTDERKNPYFSVPLSQSLEAKFQQLALQLDLRDDDQAQQSYSTIPWHRWSTWQWAYDTHLLRASDAGFADYAGMGWTGAFFP